MCRHVWALMVIVLALPAGRADDLPNGWIGSIRTEHVRPHVEFLASRELAGRSGADSAKAANYLTKQFRDWKLKPLFADGSFEQLIPTSVEEPDANPDSPKNGGGDEPAKKSPRIVGRNVGAWLVGSDPKLRDELIVIGTHFDHLGTRNGKTFRGADDNASGTAMMLEVEDRHMERFGRTAEDIVAWFTARDYRMSVWSADSWRPVDKVTETFRNYLFQPR